MKRSAIFVVVMACLTLSGCLVASLHPFYKKSDRIYDKSLEGKWIDSDSSIWVFEPHMISQGFMEPERPDSSYRVMYYEDGNDLSFLQATLFVLNGQKYIDFFPELDAENFSSDMTSMHFIPVHTLCRIRLEKDCLMLFWFGEEWLNDLFDSNRIRIDHEKIRASSVSESNILTAETEDLQKFIEKYMNDEETNRQIDDAFAFNKEAEQHVFVKMYPYDGPVPETE